MRKSHFCGSSDHSLSPSPVMCTKRSSQLLTASDPAARSGCVVISFSALDMQGLQGEELTELCKQITEEVKAWAAEHNLLGDGGDQGLDGDLVTTQVCKKEVCKAGHLSLALQTCTTKDRSRCLPTAKLCPCHLSCLAPSTQIHYICTPLLYPSLQACASSPDGTHFGRCTDGPDTMPDCSLSLLPFLTSTSSVPSSFTCPEVSARLFHQSDCVLLVSSSLCALKLAHCSLLCVL